MSKKLTYEHVKSFIESFNYQLLSTEYINTRTKIRIKCPENHKYDVLYGNFKKGARCPVCSEKQKQTYEHVKSFIESFNYQLLSTKYINNSEKLDIKCPKGHIYKASYKTFKQGHRCSGCSGNKKLLYNEVKKYIESYDYKLISTNYKNSSAKLQLQCPDGHIYKTNFNTFKQGSRCPVCWWKNSSSKMEQEIQEYAKSIYNDNIINNDRTIIINPITGHNLELDIYFPKLNKAIEFNGKYWHSSKYMKLKDNIKLYQCKKNNIDLLIINEQDWISNKQNCLKLIENFINL